jgi:phosphoglycolate phosphatase
VTIIATEKAKSTKANPPCSKISHVVFDFDGTLSWLRSGWPDVMARLFAEFIPDPERNSPIVLQHLRREILALNGKPSIYQMRRFAEMAGQFKAAPPAPEPLLQLYLARLDAVLRDRVDAITRREVPSDTFVISGARPLLEDLHQRGVKLFILSGTAEPDVRCETELLQLKPFFGDRIHGSTPGQEFSKKDVIERILAEEGIVGSQLLSFGDGPVEIEFTKAVGGWAVGVASDEENNGSGVIDPDKHEHLLRAGADAIIPDYRNTRWILDTFFA